MRAFINILEGRTAELDENLTLDQARKYRREWNETNYEKLFRRFSKHPKAFRLYFPLSNTGDEPEVPDEIDEYLRSKGYETSDYKKGLATDGQRQFKIGRLLADNPKLLKKFTNDPSRAAGKTVDYFVVISRHPYDVAGMSTDRGWTSCMDIEDGSKRHYVLSDVRSGTIIAYVVRPTDKNINNPVGRVLIKPFVNIGDDHDIVLIRENKVYGTNVPGFLATVDAWLEKVNGHKQGFYRRAPGLYSDNSKDVHAPGYEERGITTIRELINADGFTREVARHFRMLAATADIPDLRYDETYKAMHVGEWDTAEDFFYEIGDDDGLTWAKLLRADDDALEDMDVSLSEDNVLDLLEALHSNELHAMARELGIRLSNRASLRLLGDTLVRDQGHFGDALRDASKEARVITNEILDTIKERIWKYIETASLHVDAIDVTMLDDGRVIATLDVDSYLAILEAGAAGQNEDDYDDDDDGYESRRAAEYVQQDGWVVVETDWRDARRREEGLLKRVKSKKTGRVYMVDPELKALRIGVDIDKLIDAFRRLAFG